VAIPPPTAEHQPETAPFSKPNFVKDNHSAAPRAWPFKMVSVSAAKPCSE